MKTILTILLTLILSLNSTLVFAEENANNALYLPLITSQNSLGGCKIYTHNNRVYFELINNNNTPYKIYETKTGVLLGTIVINGLYSITSNETDFLAVKINSESSIELGCKLTSSIDVMCTYVTTNENVYIFIENLVDSLHVYNLEDGNIFSSYYNQTGIYKYGGGINQNSFAVNNNLVICSYSPNININVNKSNLDFEDWANVYYYNYGNNSIEYSFSCSFTGAERVLVFVDAIENRTSEPVTMFIGAGSPSINSVICYFMQPAIINTSEYYVYNYKFRADTNTINVHHTKFKETWRNYLASIMSN